MRRESFFGPTATFDRDSIGVAACHYRYHGVIVDSSAHATYSSNHDPTEIKRRHLAGLGRWAQLHHRRRPRHDVDGFEGR